MYLHLDLDLIVLIVVDFCGFELCLKVRFNFVVSGSPAGTENMPQKQMTIFEKGKI